MRKQRCSFWRLVIKKRQSHQGRVKLLTKFLISKGAASGQFPIEAINITLLLS